MRALAILSVAVLVGCAGAGDDPDMMGDATTQPPMDAKPMDMGQPATCTLGDLVSMPACAVGTTYRVPHPCPGKPGVMCIECFSDPDLHRVEGCTLLTQNIEGSDYQYTGPFFCVADSCLPPKAPPTTCSAPALPTCDSATVSSPPYKCANGDHYCAECYLNAERATGCVLEAQTITSKGQTYHGPFYCTDGKFSEPGSLPGCN